MNELEQLRARIAQLVAEVDQLREESAHTRALAAMADRDSAEVRAVLQARVQSLAALRTTQLEQGNDLSALAQAVSGLAVGQAEHSRALENISGALALILGRLEQDANR